MTFEQLNIFIAAVESETFFEAAETCHTSQSVISKQIIKLEKELDVKLFDRSSRKALLTDAGKDFYIKAIFLSDQYKEILNHMKKYQNRKEHTLSVGTLPILTQYNLTALFKSFSEQEFNIHLNLEEVEENELIKGLLNRRYALIITRNSMIDYNNMNYTHLTNDRLMVIMPSGHRLSGKPNIAVEYLKNEPLILMKPYTSIYQLCIEIFEKKLVTPHIYKTMRMESIISAVALGEGISILPEKNFNLFKYEQINAIPLADVPALSVGIASLKVYSASHIVNRFTEFAKNHYSSPANMNYDIKR